MRLFPKIKLTALPLLTPNMHNVADIISSQMKITDGSSIGAVLRGAMKLFRESDLPNPALDARLLLAEAMECAPDDLLWREPEPIELPAASKFNDFVARRPGARADRLHLRPPRVLER